MKTVTVRDIRNRFDDVLKEKEEVVILKRGVPVATMKPFDNVDLMKYYLERAQEASKEAGLTEEEGLSLLKEVREELRNENRH
ncbi:MAG: toxin-antitoxin (TA) system antitoxin [Thermotogae bacterium]|jgi:antitoxin (DNA-binding transcriptional repressor) of toxin-antitoxin stability system|nr:toxin-antitoxin (TA) system antitoxin [Thermotogota bacterium]MCL5033456.1 toxin-antitoxin (TA) system antitoxin [Thermotogota bacterium]